METAGHSPSTGSACPRGPAWLCGCGSAGLRAHTTLTVGRAMHAHRPTPGASATPRWHSAWQAQVVPCPGPPFTASWRTTVLGGMLAARTPCFLPNFPTGLIGDLGACHRHLWGRWPTTASLDDHQREAPVSCKQGSPGLGDEGQRPLQAASVSAPPESHPGRHDQRAPCAVSSPELRAHLLACWGLREAGLQLRHGAVLGGIGVPTHQAVGNGASPNHGRLWFCCGLARTGPGSWPVLPDERWGLYTAHWLLAG